MITPVSSRCIDSVVISVTDRLTTTRSLVSGRDFVRLTRTAKHARLSAAAALSSRSVDRFFGLLTIKDFFDD